VREPYSFFFTSRIPEGVREPYNYDTHQGCCAGIW
jgi:hypothetical protein